ncbi:hypothetical protein N0V93_009593 [Gnomoniopsis smithogilvyi]|uniref:tRNA(Phe) 7-[(3-amino-3-carboxypropyl)-4-demethylwyosine(37)-N(4)]-methyltransferase n=1 Tax=Gnomoniopsis smithogilvyi TaxID=1191159 RepID=A0A9W9CSU7_9PEZI|nr:hypothetical protein N0V93_009593 [Gnomoniopsis smithogilvyi]
MVSRTLNSDVAMHPQPPPTVEQTLDEPSLPSLQSSSSSSTSSSFLSNVPIPKTFTQRKRKILSALAVPDEEYTDLSPKGTVDAGIRDLIDELNRVEGFVTTSSCAGRVSVFLEGRKVREGGGDVGSGGVPGPDGGGELPGHYVADLEEGEAIADGEPEGQGEAGGSGIGGERNTVAGFGGKGGGGRWLFVSHDPIESPGKLDSEPNIVAALLGIEDPIFSGVEGSSADEMTGQGSRLIHFKFEPMILHVLTASPQHAQVVLRCGLQAGFRESGAINLLPTTSSSTSAATPIVAIRSMGLGLESLIGTETNGIKHCTVPGEYLKALINIANERFVENTRRIERFRRLLKEAVRKEEAGGAKGKGREWEDAAVRKERKRAEGLRRAEEMRRLKEQVHREPDGADLSTEALL